jgi:hypothetical protein
MVQVLYVRVAPSGTDESHITDVRWYNPTTGAMDVATTAGMVKFIAQDKGRAYVCDGSRIVEIEVVAAPTPYIRSQPDITLRKNLLSLPRF